VRDLNAFSSKKALRGSIGAVGGVVSIKILLTYLTNEAPGS
jgi:hypothetical protein